MTTSESAELKPTSSSTFMSEALNPRLHRLREAGGIFLCVVIVFSFMSLVSFSAGDLSEWQTPVNRPLSNWCGPAGAWTGAHYLGWFGVGSYFILIMLGFWVARLFRPQPVKDAWQRVFGSTLLGITVCGMFGLMGLPAWSTIMPGYGGITGLALSRFLGLYIGTGGSVLVLTTLVLITALLATDILLSDVYEFGRKCILRLQKKEAEPVKPDESDSASQPALPALKPNVLSELGGSEGENSRKSGPAVPGGSRRPLGVLGAQSGRASGEETQFTPLDSQKSALSSSAPIIDGVLAEDSDVQKEEPHDEIPAAPPAWQPTSEPQSISPSRPVPVVPVVPVHPDLNLEDDNENKEDLPPPPILNLSSIGYDETAELPGEEFNELPLTAEETAALEQELKEAGDGDRPADISNQETVDQPLVTQDEMAVQREGWESTGAEAQPNAATATDEAAAMPVPEKAAEPPAGAGASTVLQERIESLRNVSASEVKAPKQKELKPPKRGKYILPPADLLDTPSRPRGRELESRQKVQQLEKALQNFKIGAEVVDIQRGPTVTMYEIALAPRVKVNKVINLSDDLAIAMRAQSVRIVAPIPGKSTVGIEIPNHVKEAVRLRDLMGSESVQEGNWVLPLFLGKDVSGQPIIGDLTQMPHLLIAGATGSGKSVCINSLIASILMSQTPEDVRLVLIDPKMVELSAFEEIPHLLSPVVTDMKKAPGVLEWAVKKMDERYDILATVGVRHIKQFNELGEKKIEKRLAFRGAFEDNFPHHLPYIVVIVDEYADLMMVASKDIEKSITRLAQKSRAVGIHVVLATQRPSVDVITGLIKSNMTTRIAFMVTSKVDSRTILDRNGADLLVGEGDMLYLPPSKSDLIRCQGTYVSDDEIHKIVNFIRAQDNPDYEADLEAFDDLDSDAEDFAQRDALYEQAVRIVLQDQRGSVSLLQRKLEIGYTRAARLVDFMAKDGIVGGYKGSKAREVIMTLEEWENQQFMKDEVED